MLKKAADVSNGSDVNMFSNVLTFSRRRGIRGALVCDVLREGDSTRDTAAAAPPARLPAIPMPGLAILPYTKSGGVCGEPPRMSDDVSPFRSADASGRTSFFLTRMNYIYMAEMSKLLSSS